MSTNPDAAYEASIKDRPRRRPQRGEYPCKCTILHNLTGEPCEGCRANAQRSSSGAPNPDDAPTRRANPIQKGG